MKKLSFRVDDPELLDFIYSLGRERSKIICMLLRDCMEEGGGYVPPRVMAATGFSYKGKKAIHGLSATKPVRATKKVLYKEASQTRKVNKKAEQIEQKEEKEPVREPISDQEAAPEATLEPEATYVSSAPEIKNKSLVMSGLAAFGGI